MYIKYGTHFFFFSFFFFRKLLQSTRLYVKGILSGRPATLWLVNGGNESIGYYLAGALNLVLLKATLATTYMLTHV